MAQLTGGWGPGGRTVLLPTQQRQRRGVLLPVVGLVVLGICGLVTVWVVASHIGEGAVLAGALCALLPVGPVVATFLWIDRWEPEPPQLLLFAFLWGAGFAALSALLINSGAAILVGQLLGRGNADLVGSNVIAPLVEEGLKGAFLVLMLVFRRREFDGIVDGIVYAGLVAAGFAFTENILYFGTAFFEGAADGALAAVLPVLVVRGVLSPFAHPLFTAMTGIGAGIAANSRSVGVRVGAVGVGYAGAVLLHALWNSSASLLGGTVFPGIYGFIMLPVFVGMVILVIYQRRREQQVIAAQLPGFAQEGWIAPSEIALLSSLAGRRGWRAAVRRRSGRQVAKAVSDYQVAVTELAFLQSRLARGAVGDTGLVWRKEALDELYRSRMKAVGHPEALTVALRHHGPPPGGWTPPPAGPPPRPMRAPGRDQPPQSWPPPR
jgi:RsiW-degrading membrane proteinase PrsW (M82 family)